MDNQAEDLRFIPGAPGETLSQKKQKLDTSLDRDISEDRKVLSEFKAKIRDKIHREGCRPVSVKVGNTRFTRITNEQCSSEEYRKYVKKQWKQVQHKTKASNEL